MIGVLTRDHPTVTPGQRVGHQLPVVVSAP